MPPLRPRNTIFFICALLIAVNVHGRAFAAFPPDGLYCGADGLSIVLFPATHGKYATKSVHMSEIENSVRLFATSNLTKRENFQITVVNTEKRVRPDINLARQNDTLTLYIRIGISAAQGTEQGDEKYIGTVVMNGWRPPRWHRFWSPQLFEIEKEQGQIQEVIVQQIQALLTDHVIKRLNRPKLKRPLGTDGLGRCPNDRYK